MATVLELPTRHGHTVTVTVDDTGRRPHYQWTCTAGDAPGHSPYAALPFARDDATAHAGTCERRPTFPGGGF